MGQRGAATRRWAGGAIATGLAGLAFAGGLALAQAPGAGDGMAGPAAADAALATKGRTVFTSACGFCHGAEAGGGAGPALTASSFFPDDRGASLHAFLKVGRPGTGMPAFPDLSGADVEAIHAFVRSKSIAGAGRPPLDPASIVVGDAAQGRAFFFGEGGCSACHSPERDLAKVGSRYSPLVLQGRMINPRVVGVGANGPAKPPPPPKVTVTPAQGPAVSGELVQVNDLYVTLIDGAGVRRTFLRDNETPRVEVRDPLEAHRQMMLRWTDRSMWNVTAYLVSLK